MNRAEWLEWRRSGLGGSDIAVVMGCSRWSSPWELWLSKVKGIDNERDAAAQMTGRLLEDAVIQWAVEVTGSVARMRGTPVRHHIHDWMRATPDAYLLRMNGNEGLEAKVAEWPWDEPPREYELQCRWYMACTDRPTWKLAAFFRKAPAWHIYTFERDHDAEAEMMGAAALWWKRHVVHGEPPEVDGTNAAGRGLSTLHGVHPEDEWRVADDAEERLIREYADTDRALARLSVERDRLGNHLRHAIGPDTGIRFTGGRAKWSRNGRTAGRLTVRVDDD